MHGVLMLLRAVGLSFEEGQGALSVIRTEMPLPKRQHDTGVGVRAGELALPVVCYLACAAAEIHCLHELSLCILATAC